MGWLQLGSGLPAECTAARGRRRSRTGTGGHAALVEAADMRLAALGAEEEAGKDEAAACAGGGQGL